MNGSTSPDASASGGLARDDHASPPAQPNGHEAPPEQKDGEAATVTSIEHRDTDIPDAPAADVTAAPSAPAGDGDDAESEAETLIDSPVKKKETEKQQQQQQRQQPAIKTELKPLRSRIGGLPVPGEDDEDSAESPMLSTENATPARKDEDAEMADEAAGSDRDAEGSENEELSSLPSVQSDEDAEGEEDEEMVGVEHGEGAANGAESPNPRKRKHRASSVSLPNSKRRSMDPPKRRLRGMHSEADAPVAEGSTSPKLHSHRRAVSTQSALDENAAGRKRKSHFPVKEPKSANGKSGWEESDASSETASRGQPEDLLKRSSRGVGRSTSTPGRPGGREHKRHVNKYGFTKLAEACEEGKLDLVKDLREKDPDSLELAEFAGNKPLQIASLNGNADVVKYLIEQGCQIDCANVDKDTPLIDAAENGHVEVVQLLLDAGVDPLSQNLKGQQALDVVTDDSEDGPQIRTLLHKAIDTWNSSSARQRRAVEEETRHSTGPSKELHFMARTYENLLRLVANNDRNGVREFLAARVPVDNAVIAVAAKTGDVYLVNMLLAEMSEKKAGQRAEKPMLAVLGSSHWEMVQALTELETFNPMYRDRQGRNWPTLAEERAGPNWRQERELLQKLWDQQTNSSRRSSSPVSRRDGGGKRFLRRQNVDGDGSEDDAPAEMRRKNGRRLMSRKDLRAASSKAMSDSSEGDEDADAEGEIDDDVAVDGQEAMPPPDTPNRLRAIGRTRSKSTASQNSEISPRTRRRSASMREHGTSDKPLPVLKETAEETDVKREEEQKAEEARLAVEEAQRLAAKQKEEDEAEAEAKRAEEAAEAARLQAEEERKAKEAEEAEEKRRREAEEAEQARQKAAEEERQQQLARDKKAAEARERRRREALAALPPSLRHVLLPGSDFTYEGLEEKAYLVQNFTPLRVVRGDWVLSFQAAALAGKDIGLSVLLGEGELAYQDADAGTDDQVRRAVEDTLVDFPTTAKSDVDMLAPNDDDFEAELSRTADRLNVVEQMRRLFLAPPPDDAEASLLHLRLVKLSDIRQRLHPLLRDINLQTLELPFQEPMPTLADIKPAVDQDSGPPTDFFASMKKLLAAQSLQPGSVIPINGLDSPALTEVAVVHEK